MNKEEPDVYRPGKILVCFGGRKTYWWTRFLKKGFYHCFLVMGDGKRWILIDPVRSRTDLVIFKGNRGFELLKERGYNTLELPDFMIDSTPKEEGHIFIPFTCVETVKHFLGINSWLIITPYQLYKYLIKRKIDEISIRYR